MTLRAPTADHALQALTFEFDGRKVTMQDVEKFTTADILKLPDIAAARRLAAAKFNRNHQDPTSSTALHMVHVVALDSRARVVLVTFNPSGLHRIRWSFGRFADPREMMHLTAVNRSGTACGREGPATTYPTGDKRITCPNCLLGLAAAHDTTPDKLYDEDPTL